jgi:hypothetical protein
MKSISRGGKQMVDEIADFNAFGRMLDIATSVSEMDDIVVRSEAIAKLCEQLLATQTYYAAVVAQIHELEGELAKLKDWKAEREHCQVCDLGKDWARLGWKSSMSDREPTNKRVPPGRTWIPEFDF